MPVIGQLAATLISEIGVSVTEFSPTPTRVLSGSAPAYLTRMSYTTCVRHPS
jgi:hypothetical protein